MGSTGITYKSISNLWVTISKKKKNPTKQQEKTSKQAKIPVPQKPSCTLGEEQGLAIHDGS